MTTFISECQIGVIDGVGTVGYTVLDEDGAELIARTTEGVVQTFEGSDYAGYMAKITVSDAETQGIVVWDDGDDNFVHKPFYAPLSEEQLANWRQICNANTGNRTWDDVTTPTSVSIDV